MSLPQCFFLKHAQLVSRVSTRTILLKQARSVCKQYKHSVIVNTRSCLLDLSSSKRQIVIPSTRLLCLTCRFNDKETPATKSNGQGPFPKNSEGGSTVKVSLRLKRMLVLSKFYKSVQDVPEYVSVDKVNKATNLFRIKANFATMILFLLASYVTIKFGQKYRSESIAKSQQESDEYNDMMDLFDAELEQAENERKTNEAKQ